MYFHQRETFILIARMTDIRIHIRTAHSYGGNGNSFGAGIPYGDRNRETIHRHKYFPSSQRRKEYADEKYRMAVNVNGDERRDEDECVRQRRRGTKGGIVRDRKGRERERERHTWRREDVESVLQRRRRYRHPERGRRAREIARSRKESWGGG